ncbi:MAG TPA: DHA2 family efflux MFS transporter permease subunit [Candidatus Sulfotelmatobacter sp.]|nr:DHA2 family efflux MFS transporter permease subunit [Candidatus Sulfotelmatobacter sp.]
MSENAQTFGSARPAAAEAISISAPEVWRPAVNPWLIGLVVSLAAFMEVLDTSIANVALPYIAGSIGASNDESTWVLTSYLVSNAVVLPIGGWFASVLGRKRFFMLCVVVFTFSSLLCGFAPSLGTIILFRVLQGAGGGGLQPMAQAILADTFPPAKRGLAFALYGVTVVVAPTIGPTLGGWITDNYSWRWIFFINVPVGILALFLVYRLIDDPPWAKRVPGAFAKFDYVGVSLLVLGVGALQVMLDRGQEDDWFGSPYIVTLMVLAAAGLLSLGVWEWFYKNPVINMRLFKNINFLMSNIMTFMFGLMLFSSLVMMPLFLQSLMGYTAELAGFVLSGGGFVLLFLMPLVGVLSSKVQARRLVAIGWLTTAIAMYYSTQRLDLQISFMSASLLRVAQVFGIGFLFVPINLAAYVGMPAEASSSVAGLVNFMRNIGSSVGTSMVTTLLARRSQVHQVYLAAHTTLGQTVLRGSSTALSNRLLAAGVQAQRASAKAIGLLYQQVNMQASLLAYIDTFTVLSIIAAVMFVLSFVLKKNEPGGGHVAVG